MRFPHCVAIFHNLPWLSKTKVIYKKSQRSAVNACGNQICKRGFKSETHKTNSIKVWLNSDGSLNGLMEMWFNNSNGLNTINS